jgi:hypothetical protein
MFRMLIWRIKYSPGAAWLNVTAGYSDEVAALSLAMTMGRFI